MVAAAGAAATTQCNVQNLCGSSEVQSAQHQQERTGTGAKSQQTGDAGGWRDRASVYNEERQSDQCGERIVAVYPDEDDMTRLACGDLCHARTQRTKAGSRQSRIAGWCCV